MSSQPNKAKSPTDSGQDAFGVVECAPDLVVGELWLVRPVVTCLTQFKQHWPVSRRQTEPLKTPIKLRDQHWQYAVGVPDWISLFSKSKWSLCSTHQLCTDLNCAVTVARGSDPDGNSSTLGLFLASRLSRVFLSVYFTKSSHLQCEVLVKLLHAIFSYFSPYTVNIDFTMNGIRPWLRIFNKRPIISSLVESTTKYY